MSFTHDKYLPIVVVVVLIYWIISIKYEKNYLQWIKKYWFYNRSLTGRISFWLRMFGMAVLLVAILDLRGVPEKTLIEIPDQRTIILLDSSASMLAEDVKPSRFKKAILIARHFVKMSLGHQISIVLFSDMQRQVTPFTDDIDFLDSMLASLEGLDITRGGSNISQAFSESVGYLKKEFGSKNLSGNILILSDGEENNVALDAIIPSEVNVAFVGVGTNHGAPIPLRNKKGKFLKYKKINGARILSKMNESFLKKMGSKIKSYKYWVALSYSIPTGEIIDFFRVKYKERLKKSAIVMRETYSRHLAIVGVLIFILSLLMRFSKGFVYLSSFLILFSTVQANTKLYKKKADEILREMSYGGGRQDRKLKLGEYFLRLGENKKSEQIYYEIIKAPYRYSNNILFNYGTVQINNGKIQKGLDKYEFILERIRDSIAPGDLELLMKIRENTYLAFNKDKSKKNKKKSKKGKEDNKKKKVSKEEKIKNSNNKKKEKQEKKQEKKEKQEKKQEKKKREASEQVEKKTAPPAKSLKEKEEQIKIKRKMTRVPKVLNQLMDVDRNIQKKRASTSRKRRSGSKKDW